MNLYSIIYSIHLKYNTEITDININYTMLGKRFQIQYSKKRKYSDILFPSNINQLPGSINSLAKPLQTSPKKHSPVIDTSLVSTQLINNELSALFTFTHFNKMQSLCFHKLYNTNDNSVICSPTASGKTALFEIAMCRVFQDRQQIIRKAIYIGPTKALCQERMDDWTKRFSKFGITCIEITGDTEEINFIGLEKSHIIITTPEKWDSFTRKW